MWIRFEPGISPPLIDLGLSTITSPLFWTGHWSFSSLLHIHKLKYDTKNMNEFVWYEEFECYTEVWKYISKLERNSFSEWLTGKQYSVNFHSLLSHLPQLVNPSFYSLNSTPFDKSHASASLDVLWPQLEWLFISNILVFALTIWRKNRYSSCSIVSIAPTTVLLKQACEKESIYINRVWVDWKQTLGLSTKTDSNWLL